MDHPERDIQRTAKIRMEYTIRLWFVLPHSELSVPGGTELISNGVGQVAWTFVSLRMANLRLWSIESLLKFDK